MGKTKTTSENRLLHVGMLVLFAAFCYSNTFRVPFLLDDQTSIIDNPVIRELTNFYSNSNGYRYHPNRFVGYLTFALNYHFGGLDVRGYHAVNLVIHTVNGLLVYSLLGLVLRTPHLSRTGDAGAVYRPIRFLPILTALLFIVHPVQTQAVTYVVQRLTSLATLFYLVTLVCYLRWRLAHAAGSVFLSGEFLPWWVLSFVTAVLAMKTKEISFTLPAVLALCELSFFGLPDRKSLPLLAPLALTILIVPLSTIDLLSPSGGFVSELASATTASATISRGEYLLTQFSVIMTYLRLLLLPVSQNLDYDYPVTHSLTEPRALFSLLGLVALFGFALYLYRRSFPSPSRERTGDEGEAVLARLAGFGIMWFFITLSVESSVVPIRDVIFEHRVYLPSVGFLTAAVALLLLAAGRLPWREDTVARLTLVSVGTAALALGTATYTRNHVWRDWPSIWQDVKDKSPKKYTSYNNFGVYYGRQRRIPEAIREFQKAISLDPKAVDPLYNLALTYIWIGRYQEAKELSDTIRRLEPERFKTLTPLHIPQLR